MRYANSQKIGKPNNLMFFWSNKTKGTKQDGQNRLRPPILCNLCTIDKVTQNNLNMKTNILNLSKSLQEKIKEYLTFQEKISFKIEYVMPKKISVLC
jgi:hypothetical protein